MAMPVIHSWKIVQEDPITDFSESIFAVGNGYLGMRGFPLQTPKIKPQEHAIFHAGFFEPVKPGITDMVQLPDVLGFIVQGYCPERIRHTLDLHHGIMAQEWDADGLHVSVSRMASMSDRQLICVRMILQSEEELPVTVCAVMNDQVANLPVHDDQVIEEKETVRLLETVKTTDNELVMRALASGRTIRFIQSVFLDGRPVSETTLRPVLKKEQPVIVENRIMVLFYGESANADVPDPLDIHQRAWEALWQDCDIEMDADEDIQGALRWNIFQLLCNNASDDPHVSIGARGLTHGRYKGNAFWDTDIFMLPFYCWHRPEAARNLIQYRVNHLPEARELAQKQNLAGARYPWMCAMDGDEQCESWDIGLCEVHVTADVAYRGIHD